MEWMKNMAKDCCKKCGAVLNGAQICPICGTAVIRSQPPSASASVPIDADQYAEIPPRKGSPYSVMSTGSFMGSVLLFSIPVVGFIFMVVWACGGCKNRNKRNFARAYLLCALIGIAVAAIIATVFSLLGIPVVDRIQDWIASREYAYF